MYLWLPFVILPTLAPAPTEPSSVEIIYEMDFESNADTNFDDWPDNWTRRNGRDFPVYVEIGIVQDQETLPKSERCLRMDLDGGGGTIFSPPIEVSPLFGYQLDGFVKTESLVHDEAYLSITFFDAKQEYRETYESTRIVEAAKWKSLTTGPIMPPHPGICYAVIGLHLTPTDQFDLQGQAMFDQLKLARLPRMSLNASHPHNVFLDPHSVEVTCEVSGALRQDQQLRLELIDLDDQTLATSSLRLNDRLSNGAGEGGEIVDVSVEKRSDEEGFVGSVTWRPPIEEFGFYRIRAIMVGDGHEILDRTLSLVVARRNKTLAGSGFGWSLPQGESPMAFDKLLSLLEVSGVRRVKFPVWSDYSDGEATLRLARFSDQLNALGIEMVGVFDNPPRELRRGFQDKQHLTVAEVFMDSEMWRPAVDPMLVHLALKVNCWQLGLDDDDSFIDLPGLEQTVQSVRTHLKQYGKNTKLILPWRWMYERPTAELAPWDGLARSTAPVFTASELDEYLKQRQADQPPKSECWVTLKPLPKTKYDLQTRTRDLVLRMVTAKIQQADAIFLQDPFDELSDVINTDGAPAPMLLPWSTTVGMVSDTEYLGQMVLPNGSENYLFARGTQVIMVVWNEHPTTETIYLGQNPRQIDPWGQEIPIRADGDPDTLRHTISVGRLPTFVSGLDFAVVNWRLGVKFESERLESIFGRQQVAKYRIQNAFPQEVGGEVSIQAPEQWDLHGDEHHVKIEVNEEIIRELKVLFHADVTSGPQLVRLDFHLLADRQYRFSVYRILQVGLADISVEFNTWLDDNGKLIVEQTLVNKTRQALNFNCLLYVPGRRRQRQQVLGLEPGRAITAFVLDHGDELIGKDLWLRVEEIGGQRLLNFEVTAKP